MNKSRTAGRKVASLIVLTSFGMLTACTESPAPTSGPGPPATIVERDVAVPMRDGTVLRADVFRPPGDGPFPVLVYRTPYDKLAAAESYDTHLEAVARGYAAVLQDVRGRYASGGRFEPYRNEGSDGFDTIEWAAAQPWSNGKVGTFGLSYPGAVQWLAALEAPPHLRAMVPAMTFSSPRNFFYMNGVFDLSWLPWLYVNIAPDARVRQDLPGIRDREQAAKSWPDVAAEYRDWLPLAELPYLRDAAPYYFEWLQHPPEDDWWEWAEIRGRYDTVDAAVLNLSGWHDDAYGPEGAVTNFRGLVASRPKDARKTRLLLGPWRHGVGATMSRQTGDLDFGEAAVIDYDDVVLDFFDHYLRGIDNDVASAPPVRYFVMGENRWYDADAWPPAGVGAKTLYLAGAGTGGLRAEESDVAEGAAGRSDFVADPADPVVDTVDAAGPHDFGWLAKREDVLTFDTEPFDDSVRVAGAIEAVIFAACDCRDFDLWARLYDVHPDGRAFNLMTPGQDMLRASYREPTAGRQLLSPGRVYEFRLPNLLTGNRFAPGHRLRVQISASFAPHFSRNLQTGASEVTESASKRSTISVHHDLEHPSRVVLPVIDDTSPAAD